MRLFLLCLFAIVPFLAVAQMPLPSEADAFAQLAALITNFKALGPIGIAAASVSILVALANKFIPDLELKRLAVLLLSTVYGFIQLVANGKSAVEAGMLALLTYGGAIALYESIKGIVIWVKGKVS
jgi:hypothetical protein